MNRIRTTRSFALLAAAFLAACGGGEPPALTVGPVAYSEDQLLGLSPERRETLAYLTALALAVADSATDALGAPQVERWREDRLLDILAAELTLEKHGVDDAVLEAHYLTDPEWELTVRHILFFSERWRPKEHREAARRKAEQALELLRSGADFAETAARLSEEPGAEGRQGLLQPGREGSWVPEFWAAALALQPGEISPVTETQYGYHILRLEDRQVVPFSEARPVVARRVARQLDDPAAVLEAWLDEHVPPGTEADARRSAALAEASRRGLRVPESEVAELRRRWDDTVYRWRAALGFRPGMSRDEVARASLEALGNAAQNARLVRDELAQYADVFRAYAPITTGAAGA